MNSLVFFILDCLLYLSLSKVNSVQMKSIRFRREIDSHKINCASNRMMLVDRIKINKTDPIEYRMWKVDSYYLKPGNQFYTSSLLFVAISKDKVDIYNQNKELVHTQFNGWLIRLRQSSLL